MAIYPTPGGGLPPQEGAITGSPGPEPWWLVKAYSGTTPEYQTVQSWTRPDPSKTITGYGTKATVSGPYATQAAAQAAAPAGAQWGQGGPIQTSPNQAPPGVTNPLDFLGEIGDFFHRLTEANTWIRAGYILVGGTLLVASLAHMSGSDHAIAQAARKIPIIV